MFYEDPPAGSHVDHLKEARAVTNNVFAFNFDPCLQQPQATVIRAEDIADHKKPIVSAIADIDCIVG